MDSLTKGVGLGGSLSKCGVDQQNRPMSVS